jgi:hypothetical protein
MAIKAIVAGLTHMSGTARQTGNAYSMFRVHILSEQAQVNTTQRVLATVGLNPVPMDITEECFKKMQRESLNIQFPAEMELHEETDLSSGQPRVVIKDYKVLKPAA